VARYQQNKAQLQDEIENLNHAGIWSFGVLVYEMLTDRKLFDAPTVSDSLAAVLRADRDWSALAAGLPSNIRTMLRRVWSAIRNGGCATSGTRGSSWSSRRQRRRRLRQ
jgi:hypothetical protein